MTWCHLCNEVTDEEIYIEHLRRYHPKTLFVLYAVNLTPQQMEYINDVPFYMDHEFTEEDEYESLLQLCNDLGDHKIGIEDINAITQIVDRENIGVEDTCPICLERFIEIENDIYLLKACNHLYCEECITTWCEENKICPICKTDL